MKVEILENGSVVIVGLWPVEEDVGRKPAAEWRRWVHNVAAELDGAALVALVWLATALYVMEAQQA